jgi:hypothetical protein
MGLQLFLLFLAANYQWKKSSSCNH